MNNNKMNNNLTKNKNKLSDIVLYKQLLQYSINHKKIKRKTVIDMVNMYTLWDNEYRNFFMSHFSTDDKKFKTRFVLFIMAIIRIGELINNKQSFSDKYNTLGTMVNNNLNKRR